MTTGSPQDLCSVACKPLEDLISTRNNAVPLWGGSLKSHFGQKEGTESDLESEARLGRALYHF